MQPLQSWRWPDSAVASCSGWRRRLGSRRWWWWRWRACGRGRWRGRWAAGSGSAWSTGGGTGDGTSGGGGLLGVVVVVLDVIGIPSVRSIWVRSAVVCSIRRGIVRVGSRCARCSAGTGSWWWCSSSWSSRRSAIPTRTSSISSPVASTSGSASVSTTRLGWCILVSLILLFDCCNKIFTKALCLLYFDGVGTTRVLLASLNCSCNGKLTRRGDIRAHRSPGR